MEISAPRAEIRIDRCPALGRADERFVSGLDGNQRSTRIFRQIGHDTVTRPEKSAHQDPSHNPAAQIGPPGRIMRRDRPPKTRPETVDQDAGLAQTGQLELHLATQMQERASGQSGHIDSSGDDILAEIPHLQIEPVRAQRVIKHAVDQVNLPQVRSIRRTPLVVSVLDRPAGMGITIDAHTRCQPELERRRFGEAMLRAQADGDDLELLSHAPSTYR